MYPGGCLQTSNVEKNSVEWVGSSRKYSIYSRVNIHWQHWFSAPKKVGCWSLSKLWLRDAIFVDGWSINFLSLKWLLTGSLSHLEVMNKVVIIKSIWSGGDFPIQFTSISLTWLMTWTTNFEPLVRVRLQSSGPNLWNCTSFLAWLRCARRLKHMPVALPAASSQARLCRRGWKNVIGDEGWKHQPQTKECRCQIGKLIWNGNCFIWNVRSFSCWIWWLLQLVNHICFWLVTCVSEQFQPPKNRQIKKAYKCVQRSMNELYDAYSWDIRRCFFPRRFGIGLWPENV